VLVGLVAKDPRPVRRVDRRERARAGLEVRDDRRVGVEDEQSLVVGDLGGEPPLGVDGHDRGDAGGVAHRHVVLAERRREVHDARAVLGRHEVGDEDLVRVRTTGEVAERRRVRPPRQVGPGEPLDDCEVLAELVGVGRQPRLREHDALPGQQTLGGHDDDVVDVGADREREVARERPRRGRPEQRELAGLQTHADRQGRVLTRLIDVVVHAQLVVRQRRLVTPAVRQHAVALVGEALVVQLLERPDDRLHVRQVERLVVAVEVHPARLAGDVLLPLLRVPQDRRAARVVELRDAHLIDLRLVRDAEDPLGLELGRQAMGVPAEAALDTAAALRLVAPDEVLRVAREEVAVVREPVGERGAVVEDELVRTLVARGALVDRRLERVVRVPVRQHLVLEGGQVGAGRDAVVVTVQRIGHRSGSRGRSVVHSSSPARGRRRPAHTGLPPRYHPACRTSAR
jgi:hypothetical protein